MTTFFSLAIRRGTGRRICASASCRRCLYTDAQFVTAATPRQGAEITLKTPAGTFGYFANTNDEALGGGAGINFHQQMMGASWQAPLPKWAQFRADVAQRARYWRAHQRGLRLDGQPDHPAQSRRRQVDRRCVRRAAQHSPQSEMVVVVRVRIQPRQCEHRPTRLPSANLGGHGARASPGRRAKRTSTWRTAMWARISATRRTPA